MKKLILLIVTIFILSSICNAEEFLGIHGENINLSIDENTLLGIGIFLGICFFAMAMSIGLYIDHKKNESLNNMASIDILKKRFVKGEIPQEQFDLMRKSLVELNADVQNQNNVCHAHYCVKSIPEKC